MGQRSAKRLLQPGEPRHAEEFQSVFNQKGVRYTEVGLIIPPGIEIETDVWRHGLRTLHRLQNSIEFAIGDLLNYGEARYGDTYTAAMDITGKKYSTLSTYKSVAAALDIGKRRPGLSFSHHLAVMPLLPDHEDIALEILDRALEEELSEREVRFDVRTAKRDLGLIQLDDDDMGRDRSGAIHSAVRSAIAHAVDDYGEIREVSASIDWLEDLLEIAVALASSEPDFLHAVQQRAIDFLSEHHIPLQLPALIVE